MFKYLKKKYIVDLSVGRVEIRFWFLKPTFFNYLKKNILIYTLYIYLKIIGNPNKEYYAWIIGFIRTWARSDHYKSL